MNKNNSFSFQMLSTELVYCSKSSTYPIRVLKKVINKLLRKCSADPNYVNELVKNFRYSSNLFRLLTTSTNKDQIGPLAVIAKTILECSTALEQPKNPLVITLRTFLNKNNYSEITANLAKQTEPKHSLDGKKTEN